VTLTVRVPMEVRPKAAKAPAGDRPMFQGTATEVLADIRVYQALGVTHFVFDAAHPDLDSVLQNMDRFANDVRPKTGKTPDTTGARPSASKTRTKVAATKVAERSRRPSRTAHPRRRPTSKRSLP
jgi:hypothetical protein